MGDVDDIEGFRPKFRQIPRDEIPDRIGDMAITPDLLDDYRGHEVWLKFRARHTPECYRHFDALRLCLVKRVTDKDTCQRIRDAYQPCAVELRKARISKIIQQEEERRKMLAAKAKVLAADTEQR